MKTIAVKNASVNLAALDETLRAAVPILIGLRWDGDEVEVFVPDETTTNQIDTVRDAIRQHDARQLSISQQEQRTREAALTRMRPENTTALDERAFEAAPELVRQLAKRIAWLEQEMLALRARS
jgi:hypothetical protein